MNELTETIARRIRGILYRGLGHIVGKALNIGPIGRGGRQRLQICRITGQLHVEWRARDLHPWDRDLPLECCSELFRAQTIMDTDNAVARLFSLVPEVDTITIQVRSPQSDGGTILAGTISRTSHTACRAVPSPRMRLKMMGIRGDVTYEGVGCLQIGTSDS
jgi:hypothetical protein